MKYHLLAVDLDDTLLNSNSAISTRNKEAIRRAVEMGGYIYDRYRPDV
jgi:hydroxymethylpyrimidine pyrophosphatase-like HAD family hydrolase